MSNAASLVKNNLPGLLQALAKITKHEVLVGVPAGAGGPRDAPINYASLAYIHDNGAPEANIPARPFMKPGIKNAQRELAVQFKLAAQRALHGEDAVERHMIKAGLIASSSIKDYIDAGIDPPLADSTLRARARGKVGIRISKGAKQELASRAAGNAPASNGVTPLVVTGGLRNSITYVYRKK